MPPEIRRLADKFLMNPKEITVTPNVSTAETIEQFMIVVAGEDWNKRDTLRKMIQAEGVDNALVFCNRKRDVDILNKSLKKHGFNVAALHGDMSQPARLETLQEFKDGTTQILVASDVAARGLDLPKVSHVFNFDVPIHAEDYVHRIGRTGRAGRKGRALTIATPDDAKFVDAIVKFIGRGIAPIEIEGVETVELGEVSDRRRGRGGKKAAGKSASKKPRQRKAEGRQPVEPPQPVEQAVRPEEAPPAPKPRVPGSGDRVHSRPPAKEQAGSGRRKRQRDRDEPVEPVLGMGDHTPAFLLKPARISGE
jgi:superfamily II DNA/RNA helicase